MLVANKFCSKKKPASPLLAAWQATAELLNEQEDSPSNRSQLNFGQVLVNKHDWTMSLECKYCRQCFDCMQRFVDHVAKHLLTADEIDIASLKRSAVSVDGGTSTNGSSDHDTTDIFEWMKSPASECNTPDSFEDNIVKVSVSLDSMGGKGSETLLNIQLPSSGESMKQNADMDEIIVKTKSEETDIQPIQHNEIVDEMLWDNPTTDWSEFLDGQPADTENADQQQFETELLSLEMLEDGQNEPHFLNVEYLFEHEHEVKKSTMLPLTSKSLVTYLNQENGQNKCRVCNRRFLDKYRLLAHEIQHSPSHCHSCPFCVSEIKDGSNLRVHINRHMGVKPHKCMSCIRTFTTTSELKLHSRTHTGERPYPCTHCSRKFRNSTHLKAHMRRHFNDRPYSCDQCNKRFYERRLLRDHAVTHTRERPFQCHLCQKTFSRRRTLQEHLKTHSPGLTHNIKSEQITEDNQLNDNSNAFVVCGKPLGSDHNEF